MFETYTVSVWSTEGVDGEAFVDAFRSFAAAATESGGAREGMILQDVSDPSRYFIIRRWDDPDAVQRWGERQADHAEGLIRLVPAGGEAHVTTKVADLA